jgi:adenylosuccinate synthase
MNMAGIVVLGAQWGDEGKGRFVDYLASRAKYVVRFSGGNNAGHTVVYKGKKFLFTIVPSGALYQKKLMIAAGACFNPEVLLSEIDTLKKMGFGVDLMIDPRVHIVMAYHCQRDVANEAKRGKEGVGSVGFGVGYCFVDRARRGNIRFEDLVESGRLKEKLAYFYPRNKDTLEKLYGVRIEPQLKILKKLNECGRRLKKYLGDVSYEVNKALREEKMVLFEGSQGVLLDVNFGTYPYTTGSHIIAGYVFPSVGLAPQALKTIGVVKVFNSRAGGGPFPTEISIDKGPGKHILIKGHEFEEFPGVPVRARRIGWLDLPMLRYAHRLNNFSVFGLTHIDTLGGLKSVKVCTHYFYKGKKCLYPQFPGMTDKVMPIFKEVKGWGEIISSKVHRFADLPGEARDYVYLIEKETGVPIKYISVGPERGAIIIR